MNKHIYVNALDANSVAKAIKALDKFDKDLRSKADIFIAELAKQGVDIAVAKFDSAIVTGPNMTIIYPPEVKGEAWRAVVAMGYSALMIEFGTGVNSNQAPEGSPESYGLAAHGTLGQGNASNPNGWYYIANYGTGNAPDTYVTKDGKYIHTKGIPAQGCMYYTVRDLEEMFEDIARKVFGE